jgi:hypothetical protein
MFGRRSKPIEKTCGVKMADGEPCALAAGHDSTTGWETRIHQTVEGTKFTWKQGQKGLPILPTVMGPDLGL